MAALLAHQAGAAANRPTGFSTICKVMRADTTPKNTDNHNTGL
jgi:hypothetical protein